MPLTGCAKVPIQCRSEEDEEDSVYSNYKEKKLYIHEEDVGNRGEARGRVDLVPITAILGLDQGCL